MRYSPVGIRQDAYTHQNVKTHWSTLCSRVTRI